MSKAKPTKREDDGASLNSTHPTPLVPFATGFFLCTLAALGVVLVVEKGRLFRPHPWKV